MVALLSLDVSTPFLAEPVSLFPHWWRHLRPAPSVPAANNALGSWKNSSGFSVIPVTSISSASGCTLGFLVIYWTIHLFPWDFGLSFTRPPQTHLNSSGGWTSLPLLEFAGDKRHRATSFGRCLASTRAVKSCMLHQKAKDFLLSLSSCLGWPGFVDKATLARPRKWPFGTFLCRSRSKGLIK